MYFSQCLLLLTAIYVGNVVGDDNECGQTLSSNVPLSEYISQLQNDTLNNNIQNTMDLLEVFTSGANYGGSMDFTASTTTTNNVTATLTTTTTTTTITTITPGPKQNYSMNSTSNTTTTPTIVTSTTPTPTTTSTTVITTTRPSGRCNISGVGILLFNASVSIYFNSINTSSNYCRSISGCQLWTPANYSKNLDPLIKKCTSALNYPEGIQAYALTIGVQKKGSTMYTVNGATWPYLAPNDGNSAGSLDGQVYYLAYSYYADLYIAIPTKINSEYAIGSGTICKCSN